MADDTRRPRPNSQIVLILVTVFLNIMGLGLILPVLPFYGIAYGADGAQIGLLFTAFSGCQFLASPVFGALSDRVGRRPLILFDSRAPAFGAAALLGLNFVFGYFLLAESLPRERRMPKPLRQQINPVGVLVPLLRRPVLRAPLLAIFLLNVALTGFQANFAVFGESRFSLGPTEVSALFVASGLANILVQLILLPRLSRRFADPTLILTGAAAYAAGNLATGFAPIPTALWGSVPMLNGGYSLTRGPITSL